MTPTLQQQQTPIDLEIVRQVVDLLPDRWRNAEFVIKSGARPDGKAALQLRITSPAGYSDYVEPSDILFNLARRLIYVMQQFGHRLAKATYKIEMTPSEDWDFKGKYEYYE
ncbi:MAG TPA: hypothetical protein VKU01_23160 [Bryobacteraceae bacterium]|nr:hypothetical protein [Bryobacteraceae bacterium]